MRSRMLMYTNLVLFGLTPAATAQVVNVTVTIENLAPTNSISFAPLRLGFNNGTFDSFNLGVVPTAPIISVAEGGSGADWFPAFAAVDPNSVRGSVGGALLPGQTASNTFTVNYLTNPFFTFGSMVIPSNDFFIGNDSPMAYRLFDNVGNLLINNINQRSSDIWDAGSEAFDPLNAAFVVGGTNSLRTPQNGVVNFNFAELNGFNGLTTAAGYILNTQLTSISDIYRISFVTSVPEPTSMTLAFLGSAGVVLIRRLRTHKKGNS